MSNVDFVSKDIREDDLRDISKPCHEYSYFYSSRSHSLLLLISIQIPVCKDIQRPSISNWHIWNGHSGRTLEPLPNVRHLLVDPLLLQLAHPRPADVRNKLQHRERRLDERV